jgi:hypothetical protein
MLHLCPKTNILLFMFQQFMNCEFFSIILVITTTVRIVMQIKIYFCSIFGINTLDTVDLDLSSTCLDSHLSYPRISNQFLI